jgi:transposase
MKKIQHVKQERAMEETKRRAERLVNDIEYKINLIKKQDNPESAIDKAIKVLEQKFIKGKMEATLEEMNEIDAEMAREKILYPVEKAMLQVGQIERRWNKQLP